MSGILNAVVGGGGVAAPTDAYFNLTTLLLHGNGTNGAQNNTFLDSSTNNTTITRNGNTTQGTFSPFSQTGWSNYFGGNGDQLNAPVSAISNVGSNNFSFECWVYALRQTNTFVQGLISYGPAGSTSTSSCISFQITSSGYLATSYAAGDSILLTDPNLFPINQWTHCAVCRSGSTISLFKNGVRVATSSTSATVGGGGDTLAIGGQWFANASTRQLQGYISNVRIVNGSSAYDATQSTITVPTTPLTAITNTSLLTCQTNYFKDNSTNALAITPSGTSSVQAFSPFAPTAVYSTSSNGGSGYFDGNGDYLATPTSGQFTASGDFTVSCWFYLTSFASQYYGVAGNWNAGASDEWLIQIQNDGSIRFLTSAGSSFSSGGFVKLNQWTYFTATRSGTTVTVQLNGTTVSTYTKSDTLGSATKALNIGQQIGNVWPFVGYIADFRLLSGSAITAIPTAPSSSSGTGFLLSCTNAGIFDNAAKTDLETVSTAQISTTQSKFGSASMYFDGSGYLKSPSSVIFDFGSNPSAITMECWIYPTSLNGSSSQAYGIMGPHSSTSDFKTLVYVYGNGKFAVGKVGTNEIGGSAGNIVTNSWQHIAVVLSATTTTLYVNGTSVGSGTTAVWSSGAQPINVAFAPSPNLNFTGYIDDIRITNYARYTSNFTVPSAPFPDK
jgi:hypothetical protein